MSSHDFEAFTRSTLEEAVQDLVASPQPNADGEGSLTSVAVIGFAGNEVRGSLGLAASDVGLDRIADASGACADDPLSCLDSLGELANLILGHIKRRWDRRGVHVTISTPLTLRGLAIEVCGQCRTECPEGGWIETRHGENGDVVQVWLDFHCRGEVALLEETDADSVADQGDAIFF